MVRGGIVLTNIEGLPGSENADYRNSEGAFSGNVYGSYVHGIFDKEGVAVAVLGALAKRKGVELSSLEAFDYQEYKEQQYDILADMVRQNMDMEKVYEIMGLKG